MIVIDEIKFRLILPEILIEYLNKRGIINVFEINNDDYILKSNVSEEDKNEILNMSLHLIGSEAGQFVLEDELLMEEFNKINIFYSDRLASHLFKKGNALRANQILKSKIEEIHTFKENILNEEKKRFKY